MRKKSIVQEFKTIPKSGLNIMEEKTNFLCGKMMDIQDEIKVTYSYNVNDISNFNNPNINSPFNINQLVNKSYDSLKRNAILSFNVAENQTDLERQTTTKWIMKFDSKYLLREYLYNEIYTYNPQSAFKKIDLNLIPGNKVNLLCYDYINKNVLDRYRLKEFILYTKYFELNINKVPASGTDPIIDPVVNILYQKPEFTFHAIPDDLTQKESIALKEFNNGIFDIAYKQKTSSQYETFIYYFDVIYEKI